MLLINFESKAWLRLDHFESSKLLENKEGCEICIRLLEDVSQGTW